MRKAAPWPLAAPCLIAIVALISGCGSSAPADGGGGSNAAANAQQAVKFSECMRSNGVSDFPDLSAAKSTIDAVVNGSSLDPNAPAFKQAMRACKDLEPAGFTGAGKRSSQQMQAALKFAQCVRANGVPDFPDPTTNGPLIDVSHGRSIPGLQAAARKCLALNPDAIPASGH